MTTATEILSAPSPAQSLALAEQQCVSWQAAGRGLQTTFAALFADDSKLVFELHEGAVQTIN